MDIIVCVKQIIDPELPASQFRLDQKAKRQDGEGLNQVISAYDQNALEVALQLRDKHQAKVTALSLGEPKATSILKSAMGMGADAAVLVSDPPLLESDPFGVAHILAKAIQKLGQYDLILTGCESGDWGDKVVGSVLAEELGLPCITYASRIEARDGKFVVRRTLEDGFELIEAKPPLVVTIVSDDSNTPRYAKLKDIMAAGKKQVPVWKAADLGLDPSRVGVAAARAEIMDICVPARESKCEIVEGATAEEKAERLALRLRELKVI